jgi:hypothetical protein
MKHFEILIKTQTTLVVEAEDENSAMEFASDEIGFNNNGFELDRMSVESEPATEEEIQFAIKTSPWHRHDGRNTPYQTNP